MIMVDQLWLGLWFSKGLNYVGLSEKEKSMDASSILTAFPDSTYARPDNFPREKYRAFYDIRQRVFAALEKKAKSTDSKDNVRVTDVAAEILSAAILGTVSFRDDGSLNFYRAIQPGSRRD